MIPADGPDPRLEPHYVLSEAQHLHLQDLRDAMGAVATLAERPAGQDGPEGGELAALFRVFSTGIDQVVRASPFVEAARSQRHGR